MNRAYSDPVLARMPRFFHAFSLPVSGDRSDAGKRRACAEALAGILHAEGLAAAPVATLQQVHGRGVRILTGSEAPAPDAEGDALVTNVPGLPIGVTTADCVPVLVADPVAGAAAAIHGGWRGLLAGVIEAAVRRLADAFGSEPGNLRAAVGPAIGRCCYEVSEDVAGRFRAAAPDNGRLLRPAHGEKWFLDLKGAAALRLRRCGLPGTAISVLPQCTCCGGDRFASYRRDGHHERSMLNAILIRKERPA